MSGSNSSVRFTALTFGIAYLVSGILIIMGRFGYRFYNWVASPQQFAMDIPFAIYILSPAIASYAITKKKGKTDHFREWLKTIFYAKNNGLPYAFVAIGLVLYFSIHAIVSGYAETALPFYTLLLSLPGNLFIGGLEEAGWAYVLQPRLDQKFGYVFSCIITGGIWILWHIPLFFIPGTNHGEGLIDFRMFAVQCLALRFFLGAICKIAGKSSTFMCVLFHTVFNAATFTFAAMTATWKGAIAADAVMILVSIVTVVWHNNRFGRSDSVSN